MRQDHRFQRKRGLSEDQRRMLSMALIPLIVIVLIIVIVIADHAKGKDEVPDLSAEKTADHYAEASEGAKTNENGEAANNAVKNGEDGAEDGSLAGETEGNLPEGDLAVGESDAFESEKFHKDGVPEILDLMKKYFKARADGDAETMNQVYGIENVSPEALEAQKTRMRSNANYVNEFQNVTTYVMNGTTTNSWLVYALADIKFYTAKTTAPMVMWCYVQKDTEGNYRIMDNSQLSSNVLNYIEAANHSQEVRSLAADVSSRLKKALNEDEELNTIYGVLRDGSPVWQGDGEGAEVVVLDDAEQEPEESGESGGPEESGESREPEESGEEESMPGAESGSAGVSGESGGAE